MAPIYLLAFCRLAIGLVFGISFLTKARHLTAFEQTIARFALLPKRFSRPLAYLFLGGELLVVVLVALGGPVLAAAFGLAIVLLLLFSGALVSVLRRQIHTSCNCFGASEKPVAASDVWRNAGLLLCAILGCAAVSGTYSEQGRLSLAEWGVIGLGATAFVAILLNMRDILQLIGQE